MKITLIICTYKRHDSLYNLLYSVNGQLQYPDEILIIDGSPDYETRDLLSKHSFKNLKYHRVKVEERGLTKQRNIGIELCLPSADVIAFLDDDVILEQSYFKSLLEAYKVKPDAIAIGGYIKDGSNWIKTTSSQKISSSYFCFDGYCKKDGIRFKIRKILGLEPNRPPAMLPKFSHGRSVAHLPPSGKIYEVEQFMGGVSSYKSSVFNQIKFSTYFEGYGLYEDADFCFRLLKYGKLYVNTSAQCNHFHHPSGRPNHYKYGKMVVRNGWYVWRLRWPNPGLKNIIKWHITCFLLIFLRFLNTFTTSKKSEAFLESMGRLLAWFQLLFNKPNISR